MKALKYFFTNVNLVLPVVAAVVVIVSAIVFICVFKAKNSQMMTPGNNIIFHFFPYICIEKIGGAFEAGEENEDKENKSLIPGLPEWLDLNIIVPTIATVIVICVGIIIVCAVLVISKRRIPQMTPGFLKNIYIFMQIYLEI